MKDIDRICWFSPKELIPYEKNPRKNKKAVDAVAASIKEYGFNSPILIQPDRTIINGHTRWKAAKKLKMDRVPCIIADGLTEEQIKQYRIIDNKTSEIAEWDKDLLAEELDGIEFDNLDFQFDFEDDLAKRKSWGEEKETAPCNLEDARTARKCAAGYYLSCYGTDGGDLTDLKTPENVESMSNAAWNAIKSALGDNLCKCNWCIVTTPKRRHSTGFHFATEVCKNLSAKFEIPFYDGAMSCKNKHRIGAVFTIEQQFDEKNVILYDDIITTGETLRAAKQALIDIEKTVFIIVSVDNH